MTKAFDQIMDGLEDVARFMEGETDGFEVHLPDDVDVRAIRKNLRLSQPQFAKSFGLSVGRVRDWEQKRSPIDAPARAFFTVLAFEPEAVRRAMAKAAAKTGPTGRPRTGTIRKAARGQTKMAG